MDSGYTSGYRFGYVLVTAKKPHDRCFSVFCNHVTQKKGKKKYKAHRMPCVQKR